MARAAKTHAQVSFDCPEAESKVAATLPLTRFEQIAAAFPLHAQRIAEAVYAFDPRGFEAWRDSEPDRDAGWTLYDAFDWSRTPEGVRYWYVLAEGATRT